MLHLYSTVLFAVLAANAVAILLARPSRSEVENATLEAEVDARKRFVRPSSRPKEPPKPPGSTN